MLPLIGGFLQGLRSSSQEHQPPTAVDLAAGEWFNDEPSFPLDFSPTRSRTWFPRDHQYGPSRPHRKLRRVAHIAEPSSSMPSLPDPATRRPASKSKEELELLGDYTNHTDAVSIGKPAAPAGSSVSRSSKPRAHRQFAPVNTLQQSSPYAARPKSAHCGSKYTSAGSLQLESSRGENVPSVRAPKFRDDHAVSYKRQKLSHPTTPPSAVVDLTDEDPPIPTTSPPHRAKMPNHEHARAKEHFRQYHGSRSNGSIRSRPSLQSLPSGSDEFNKVELTMNPKGYGSAPVSQESLGSEQPNVGQKPAVSHGQPSQPIEVDSDDGVQSRGREKFIMNTLLEEIAPSQEPRKSSVKNKLFGQRLPNNELHNDDSHPGSQRRLAQGHGRKVTKGGAGSGQSHDVRVKPTATATTIDDGSEDELSQEIPRALPKQREKHIRDFDAEEQMKSRYFTENMDVDHHQSHPRQSPGSDKIMSKADIKPTMFAPKNSGNTSLQRPPKKTGPPRRSWPLKLFKIPHCPPMSDTHLVWDHGKKHFAVHGLEGPIPIGNGVVCVEESKVTRITHSDDDNSAKVVIYGPHTDGEPYKRLIEFTNIKDRNDFVDALPTTAKRVTKSGDSMDKMFAKADENSPKTSLSKPVDSGVEYAMLESRDNLRRQGTADRNGNKERTQDKANTNVAVNGRPRADTRLISRMQVDPSRAESSTRTSRASRATESLDMTTSRTPANMRRTRANDEYDESSKTDYLEMAAQPENSWPQINFPREWKQPLVYPPTGRQRAQVDWADLFKLDDGEFLNDSIISFYMTWAAKQAEEHGNLRPGKVYWFNTYFYSTLTKYVKGQKGINYAGVQRWTSKVDIFSYDYVVVPINEDQHWYLAIICNLPALAKKVQHQEPEAEIEYTTKMKDLPKNGLAAQVHGALSEKLEPPSDNTKESCGMGEAMDIDQSIRTDGATRAEKLDSERDEGETRMTTPQPNTDDAQTETQDDIKAVPNGQDDTSKLSPGGKKGRKKQGPPSRKLDPEQPVIIMLDSLELTHPKTTKNLKAYLVEEGEAKRGMDIDMKTLQGTTAKCIPTQDNFCDCGIFVCLYFEKFINGADNFVHKIFRREMDKTRDWPDISPPKTRRDILGLLKKLEEEQSRERDEQRKKRREEKRKLLEGKGDGLSVSIPGQSSPSATVEPERASKPPSGSPPPALVSTKATEPQTPTPPPRASTPKTGRNPVVVIQASPVQCQGSSANLGPGKSPRKRTLPAETTSVQEYDVAILSPDNRKRKESPLEASDNDLAMEDAEEPVQSIETRHTELHEQSDRAGHSLCEGADDRMDLEIEQDGSEGEIPDSQTDSFELEARKNHEQWMIDLKEASGNGEGPTEVQKQRSPSQRRQQQKKRKTTPTEVIEIDDSQS